VRPKARSNISFSSSVASGNFENRIGSFTITWQVEQAHEPSHAPNKMSKFQINYLFFVEKPSKSTSFLCAISKIDVPTGSEAFFKKFPSLSKKLTETKDPLSKLAEQKFLFKIFFEIREHFIKDSF